MKKHVRKLPGSMLEIEVELDAKTLEEYYPTALKKIGENFEIKGFRKGRVPEDVLKKHVSEMTILEEMAEMAVGEYYPKILAEEKIDAIGRPEITLTKIARGNPLGFQIKIAVLPTIKLGNYKKIAKKVLSEKKNDEELIITNEELKNTIMDIRKSRAPHVHISETPEHKEGEKHEEHLPEFNDEFVKSLGPFSSTEDFKNKLKENLRLEKQNTEKEKVRLRIMEKIIEESELEVPDILINLEVDKILYHMESDITQMGLKFEDYLKHLNKKVEDLRKEFKKDGEKKAKLSLILNEIAKTEKIEANKEEVAKEVTKILEHYKEADPERARIHAEGILTNEKIFQFLENQ